MYLIVTRTIYTKAISYYISNTPLKRMGEKVYSLEWNRIVRINLIYQDIILYKKLN